MHFSTTLQSRTAVSIRYYLWEIHSGKMNRWYIYIYLARSRHFLSASLVDYCEATFYKFMHNFPYQLKDQNSCTYVYHILHFAYFNSLLTSLFIPFISIAEYYLIHVKQQSINLIYWIGDSTPLLSPYLIPFTSQTFDIHWRQSS